MIQIGDIGESALPAAVNRSQLLRRTQSLKEQLMLEKGCWEEPEGIDWSRPRSSQLGQLGSSQSSQLAALIAVDFEKESKEYSSASSYYHPHHRHGGGGGGDGARQRKDDHDKFNCNGVVDRLLEMLRRGVRHSNPMGGSSSDSRHEVMNSVISSTTKLTSASSRTSSATSCSLMLRLVWSRMSYCGMSEASRKGLMEEEDHNGVESPRSHYTDALPPSLQDSSAEGPIGSCPADLVAESDQVGRSRCEHAIRSACDTGDDTEAEEEGLSTRTIATTRRADGRSLPQQSHNLQAGPDGDRRRDSERSSGENYPITADDQTLQAQLQSSWRVRNRLPLRILLDESREFRRRSSSLSDSSSSASSPMHAWMDNDNCSCPWEPWEEPSSALDPLCCVCMVGLKGAAFTPCGHTFCRKCSREVWKSRGSCPLCNTLIVAILDIY